MLDYSGLEDRERKSRYLSELTEYVIGGSYTNTRHKEYLLRNYSRPVKDQMLDLKISQQAIYKNRKMISDDLERRVGKDIVSNILTGNYDDVETVLNYAMSDQPITKIILPDVIETIRDREEDVVSNKDTERGVYELHDCIDEIKLLKRYSVLDLELALDLVDVKKLGYLTRLLNFEESDVKSRTKLLEIIKK